jgi:hypothetical protein
MIGYGSFYYLDSKKQKKGPAHHFPGKSRELPGLQKWMKLNLTLKTVLQLAEKIPELQGPVSG